MYTPNVTRLPKTRGGELLTLAQVLAELDVPKSTFFRWKAIGKAPRTIKYPNGSLRIRRTDLDAWLTAHEEDAAA
ncbi:helix-turn-helix transcriptional regulator [Dactylosporangium sp. CA-233914]|uniref:helix-turn-helix transcriptional regulator n=1 Tax=Dactylosporangium sp. CA-233914 TaxID=3239934 RepID=UPI003D8A785C